MNPQYLWWTIGVAALWLNVSSVAADIATKEAPKPMAVTAIPDSVRAEHHAIHAQLEEAMKAPGQTGVAARTLATVLHPHFIREEEIALPPLVACTD